MYHSEEFIKLVEKTRKHIKEITPEEVIAYLQNPSPTIILLDIREDHEWEQGYIPTAYHLSKGILERDIVRLFPEKDAIYVLYCGGGYRSVLAAYALNQMGYQNVLSMSGGLRKWIEKGLPYETP